MGEASFTLVFEGDIRKFDANPLKAETPFGTAYAVSVGDVLEVRDILHDALEKLASKSGDVGDIAQKALDDEQAAIVAGMRLPATPEKGE